MPAADKPHEGRGTGGVRETFADLTDDEWASICKMTFSMELFEEAILNGTIDKKVLQKNSKMKPKTAFPKIT